MDTRIARPLDSRRAATRTRAYTDHPVAVMRPRAIEKSAAGSASPNRPHPKATAMTTGPTETIKRSGVAIPRRNQLPTGTATIPSRPVAAPPPRETANKSVAPLARNFSRRQAGAATYAARPNMRGKAVKEVGFENWAFRHESIAALPKPARGREYARAGIVRSYKGRVPSVILEDDESEQLSALPSTASTPTASEKLTATVRWQGERARRRPVHVHAAPIRSQAASLVTPTATAESARPTVASRPLMRARPSPLPSSPLRHAHPGTVGIPRTYMDMHDIVERVPTRLLSPLAKAPAEWGVNYSPYSAGTTVRDIERRAKLARKFAACGSAQKNARREGVFAAPFVDAPVLVGGGRRKVVLEAPVVAAVAATEVGDEPADEKKGKWRRFSGFLSRKLGRKGKGASSPSSSPSLSASSPPSPRTPVSAPSLVYGPSVDTPPSPATPARREPESPAIVARAPLHEAGRVIAREEDVRRSISPLSQAEKAHRLSPPLRKGDEKVLSLDSEPVSSRSGGDEKSKDGLAQAAAASLALRSEYDELMGHRSASPCEDEELSPLRETDAELFPSQSAASKRWARDDSARDEALQEALTEAFAEENAAADWSGSLVAQAEQVEYDGKGKARLVDVPPARSRYRARQAATKGPEMEAGEGNFSRKRRDTPQGEDGRVRMGSRKECASFPRGPIVAISGLRS